MEIGFCASRLYRVKQYEEIRQYFSGEDEPPRFIVRRGPLILALCLRVHLHPRIYSTPAEVWIEEAGHIDEWGERLAWDTGAVPVYVSHETGKAYRELGVYAVEGSSTDSVELAQRMAFPGIPKLSRIVFLKSID